jgi:hypothetical protein
MAALTMELALIFDLILLLTADRPGLAAAGQH